MTYFDDQLSCASHMRVGPGCDEQIQKGLLAMGRRMRSIGAGTRGCKFAVSMPVKFLSLGLSTLYLGANHTCFDAFYVAALSANAGQQNSTKVDVCIKRCQLFVRCLHDERLCRGPTE